MSIKRPGNGRASYALIVKGKTIFDPRIDLVNLDATKGVPQDELLARMRAIRSSFYPKTPLFSTNLRIVEDCHKAKLRRKPLIVDSYALKRGLIRAVEVLGTLPLTTATEQELVDRVSGLPHDRRFQVVKGINELLRFLKRGFTLYNPKPPRAEEIAYITIEEFLEKCKYIENEDYILYLQGLLATGCRWGELCEAQLSETEARITLQMDKKGVRRPTKNKKGRIAPVIPRLKGSITRLNALGRDRLRELRLNHYPAIRRAMERHVGLRIHDLRHSYAVELGTVGATTDEIARAIGDTVAVCDRHYRNYLATPSEIQRLLKLWD